MEIEFAFNIPSTGNQSRQHAEFYLLQMRPIVDSKEIVEEDLRLEDGKSAIVLSHSVLGNGIMNDVNDVLYVKTTAFNASDNPQIAREIADINRNYQGTGYILVGPGRWGSSDPWLGIPVKFPDIAAARVIIECGLDNYRVDPSQGTHFFQNLTSLGVGYMTINPFRDDGIFDEAYLDTQSAITETPHVRLVHFDHPLPVLMDGRRSIGIIRKPDRKNIDVL